MECSSLPTRIEQSYALALGSLSLPLSPLSAKERKLKQMELVMQRNN